MNNISRNSLRAVIILFGIGFILIGINVGFGGITTLGFQGSTDFLEVTDPQRYAVQDSHVRFLGGVFGGFGLFLLLAATNMRKYHQGLNLILALTFIGGLTRFTAMQPSVIFGSDIIGSLIGELLITPLLFLWLSRVVKPPEDSKNS